VDTIIVGGTVVTETAVLQAHIGIESGKISSISSADGSVPSAREVIDGRGLVIVPGSIDAHTHFTGAHHLAKEEVQVGTRGAAAGGVTTIIEMPHSDPPATTLERFLMKREMMTANSVVDFALWGGIDGSRLDQLPLLDRAGAAAMKGFMCSGDPSGRAADERGLPMLDDHAIVGAMRTIKAFDGLIGLHAENHFILHGCMAELKAAGRHEARAHAEAGPEIAEVEAVARAIFFAKETGVRCHIVHLSSAKAAALIRDARKSSSISTETCPQYLILDEDDLDRIGAYARCGPPIRKRDNVEALWSFVFDGEIDSLASDHCPYLPEQKVGGFQSIWNAAMGLTGIQTMSPLFFSEGVNNRSLSLFSILFE
jgi:allantoinase